MLGVGIDIDGVLVNEKKAIPGAVQAIKELKEAGIPFLLITNNTAPSQEHKANDLNQILDSPGLLSAEQCMLNYTPIKMKLPSLQRNTVLVISRSIHQYQTSLGLHNYVTTCELAICFPSLCPISQLNTKPELRQATRALLCKRLGLDKFPQKLAEFQLGSIVILSTPVDWDECLNIAMAVFTYQGAAGLQFKSQKELGIQILCVVKDSFLITKQQSIRFLVGQFSQMLDFIYSHFTGFCPLEITYFGKPSEHVFAIAEEKLSQIAGKKLTQFCMVGDNPETDVAGANKRGWKSLLVRSGVYGDWPLQNEQVPTKVVDNIYDAVKLIKANLHCQSRLE